MGGKKRRGSSKPPSDCQGKKEAVEQFRLGRATAQQKTWLKSQGVDLRKTASKQHSVLSEILVQAQMDKKQAEADKMQAQIDEKQAQIKVVEAMRSEATRKELSADDRVFLETKGLNPGIPAADQEVKIKELLDKLEEEKAAMTLLRNGMKDLNVHHFVRMGTLLEREVQVKAVIEELLGALERKQGVWDSELSKTRVLTITGVKGCGKTMFMRHLAGGQAGGKAQQGFIESSRVGGKAVVVSFNETGVIAHMKGRQGRELLRSFGVLLLAYNKVPLETAEKIASFDEAILLMREELGLSATEPLTVLVDEIIMLKDLNEGKDWQVTALVTYLKKYQDWTITGNMPVLFVFSSPEQYMAACATVSGSRVVETVNLECLSDDSATLSNFLPHTAPLAKRMRRG